jgi:hypothetical protein
MISQHGVEWGRLGWNGVETGGGGGVAKLPEMPKLPKIAEIENKQLTLD